MALFLLQQANVHRIAEFTSVLSVFFPTVQCRNPTGLGVQYCSCDGSVAFNMFIAYNKFITGHQPQQTLLNCAFVCLVSYKGPLLDDKALTQAVSSGASSPEFTKLCAWLVSELRLFCKLEENVQATNSK